MLAREGREPLRAEEGRPLVCSSEYVCASATVSSLVAAAPSFPRQIEEDMRLSRGMRWKPFLAHDLAATRKHLVQAVRPISSVRNRMTLC